jgi:5-methylcytosine-specific restriction endonuclease McrA
MRRDGNRCQIGGPSCLRWASEVDHVVPRIAGGTDSLDNLRSVCKPCHKRRLVDAIRGESEAVRPQSRYSYGHSTRAKVL